MSMQGGVEVASRIIGWGSFAPERVVPNSYFESYLETNDQWITERTGIRERRWADENIGSSDLGVEACKAALVRAGITADDIDGVICATATPDSAFPSTACLIQQKLGAPANLAFDVSAACTGFVYALTTADAMIRAGQCKNVLVVGSEVFSSIIDQQDRSTCILFGDGAGAVVLSAVPEQERAGSLLSTRGFYASELRADGSKADILYAKLGSAYRMTEERFKNRDYFVHMEGREVFKFAVRSLTDISNTLLGRMEVSLDDVDWIVSHQANQRIIAGMVKSLGVEDSKVPSNVAKYGNTSAASIPLLLSELADDGRLQEGQLVLINGVGGGMTWGATLLRW